METEIINASKTYHYSYVNEELFVRFTFKMALRTIIVMRHKINKKKLTDTLYLSAVNKFTL